MYPNLQNDDLVLFKQIGQHSITNGTIIVFVQSDTGVTALDSLTKPIVIHRVVGFFVQANGEICYTTKGDNNKVNDASAIPADHVLGTPVLVIPKVGILLVFLSSSQGLVASIGFITIFYLGSYETKLKENEVKESFLGELGRMMMNGEISEEVFKKFEFAVRYGKNGKSEKLKDSGTLAILDWLKNGALQKGWKIKKASCTACSGPAITFKSDKGLFTLCSKCAMVKSKKRLKTRRKKKECRIKLQLLRFRCF